MVTQYLPVENHLKNYEAIVKQVYDYICRKPGIFPRHEVLDKHFPQTRTQ